MTDYTLGPEQQCVCKKKHCPIQANMKKKKKKSLTCSVSYFILLFGFPRTLPALTQTSLSLLCAEVTQHSLCYMLNESSHKSVLKRPALKDQSPIWYLSVICLISHHTQKASCKKKKLSLNKQRVKGLILSTLGILWMKRLIEPVLFHQVMYAYSLSINRTDKSFHVCGLRQGLALKRTMHINREMSRASSED